MIRFADLSKSYGSIRAVRGLSLEVRPGEVYALLGPNGAGKTSALRCLATLIRPTGGTASVDGFDIRTDPLEVRGRIGFLAASTGLYERLTPLETLRYFGRLQGVGPERLERRIGELVDTLGIGGFADRRCGTLSTGQRQRVSIGRALVHDPPALVLDEPTLGLDVVSGEAIYRFVERERGRGKAILLSTHQMAEVELVADRVGVLRSGTLVAEDAPEGLIRSTGAPNLTRAFLRLVGGRSGGEEPPATRGP